MRTTDAMLTRYQWWFVPLTIKPKSQKSITRVYLASKHSEICPECRMPVRWITIYITWFKLSTNVTRYSVAHIIRITTRCCFALASPCLQGRFFCRTPVHLIVGGTAGKRGGAGQRRFFILPYLISLRLPIHGYNIDYPYNNTNYDVMSAVLIPDSADGSRGFFLPKPLPTLSYLRWRVP